MNEAATGSTRVRMIPATVRRCAVARPLTERLRVAAYARVSTDDEEQQTSYEAQVDYYTKKIRENPEWIFVEVYADEGITGTSTKRRKNFNRMIDDAMAGRIDRIITKSVSRFARNTVDTLTTVRKLKEKGVGVTFEKENIDTLDSKGELFITIMSSLAQEESRSISENVTWGWRKRIADGKVSVAYSHFLGYEKGPDGNMQIVEEEAKVVREIYAMFLDGKTPSGIAAALTKRSVPTPAGKATWQASTVKSILSNEKYRGDALLQKTFTVDFLTKKAKVNEGEAPQYYVENSHPAIVSAEVFELTQVELARRRQHGRHTSATTVFSGRLVCGECGAYFGSKVWHSTDAYRSVVYRCNRKYEQKGKPCSSPHVREEEIKAAFEKALGMMLERRSEIFSAYETMIANLIDTSQQEREMERTQARLDEAHLEMERMARRNAEIAQDQEEYNRAFDALSAKCSVLKEKVSTLKAQLAAKAGRKRNLEAFMERLREEDIPASFDEHTFAAVVDQVAVYPGKGKNAKKLAFRFRDGTEIAINL